MTGIGSSVTLLKKLYAFKVMFGSQYRALAPLGAVPQVNVTPNY